MKQALIGIGSGLVAGGLALTLLFLGPLRVPEPEPTPVAQEEVSPEPTESTEPEPEPTVEPCSVKDLEEDPLVLSLQAQVINPVTGEVLFDRSSDVAARPASVQKLLVAAAALEVLGTNYRVITRVYQDRTDPGTIYFVGAGDPTLSRLTGDKQSVYRNAPKLEQLAALVNRSLGGQKVTRIVLDSSLFGGPTGEYQSVWDQRGLTDGYMSYVSALQVDGDRDNPAALSSKRSTEPVQRAGDWFKRALGAGAASAKLEIGTAALDAREIAQISSRPISEWISYMLRVSDNTLSESLARIISLDLGLDGSFSSLTTAVRLALKDTGLDLSQIQLEDGSGLSRYNQIPPSLVNQLLLKVSQGFSNWGLIQDSLPVAGESGSLSARFESMPGKVWAKTGWIRTGYTLAGYLQTPQNERLIFTVYNLGDSVTGENREAMDRLVQGFAECGLALADR